MTQLYYFFKDDIIAPTVALAGGFAFLYAVASIVS